MKTTMNIENLEKLARYLLQPELAAAFDMHDYSESGNGSHEPTCGSVGCAIGHGPYAGIPKEEGINWYSYARASFISPLSSPEWIWCFSGFWGELDNTPRGAAMRILCLTRGEGLPTWFKQALDEGANECGEPSRASLKDNLRVYNVTPGQYDFDEEYVQEFLAETQTSLPRETLNYKYEDSELIDLNQIFEEN